MYSDSPVEVEKRFLKQEMVMYRTVESNQWGYKIGDVVIMDAWKKLYGEGGLNHTGK